VDVRWLQKVDPEAFGLPKDTEVIVGITDAGWQERELGFAS